MKISTILQAKGDHVHTVAPETTLKDMVGEMVELQVGSLIVTNSSGAVVGIFTERDFLKSLPGLGAGWEQVRVGDVMTRDPVIGTPEDTLEQVMALMSERRIRHLPIMEADRLVGVLSIRDLMEASLRESTFYNKLLKRYIKNWPESD